MIQFSVCRLARTELGLLGMTTGDPRGVCLSNLVRSDDPRSIQVEAKHSHNERSTTDNLVRIRTRKLESTPQGIQTTL